MTNIFKSVRKSTFQVLTVALGIGALAGCQPLEGGNTGGPAPGPSTSGESSPPSSRYVGSALTGETINVGEAVEVTFSDLPFVMPPFRERVKPDGAVTLLYSQKFQFAGKNRGDLEQEIRDRYVPGYFKNLTVTIQMADRYFFVNGEVKLPNRYVYAGETTVLKAISTAGGFTDYARRGHVQITRAGGKTVVEDCDAAQDNPTQDLPVYPGDSINVPRRLL